MWFDRNGWMVVTPIALALVIGAAMLRSSYAPEGTLEGSGQAADWRNANWRDASASQAAPADSESKAENPAPRLGHP